MSHEPIFNLDPDISKRLEKLDGEGLEIYVADLLSVFKPLGWKVYVTKTSHDMGGDLILDNPDGVRYVIQAKHRQDEEKSIGLRAVQQAVAAKAAYGAQHSIAMSNAVDFSEPAVKLAKYNGTILWRKEQLQTLYYAAINRDEALLAKLGLELGKPDIEITFPDVPKPSFSSLEQPKPSEEMTIPLPPKIEQSSRIPRRWAPMLLLVIGIITAIVIGVGLRRSSPNPEKLIRDAVIGYDLAYRQALLTNDTSPLLEFAAEEIISRRIQLFVDERIKQGCTLRSDENKPMSIFQVSLGLTDAKVSTQKDWVQILRCQGKPDRVVNQGIFNATYTLRMINGAWKIVETSGN